MQGLGQALDIEETRVESAEPFHVPMLGAMTTHRDQLRRTTTRSVKSVYTFASRADSTSAHLSLPGGQLQQCPGAVVPEGGERRNSPFMSWHTSLSEPRITMPGEGSTVTSQPSPSRVAVAAVPPAVAVREKAR